MPQFKSYEGQPIRHDLLGAYISGRAQKLAYEHDKARKDLIDEQLAQLAFQNSPEGQMQIRQDRQMERERHIIARQKALREKRKEKRLQQAHNRDEVLVDADGGITTITYDDEGKSTVTQKGRFGSPSIPGAGTGPEYERVRDVIENNPAFDGLDDDDLKEVAARVLADTKALQHKRPGLSFSDALTDAMSKHASRIKSIPGKVFPNPLFGAKKNYKAPSANDPLGLFTNEPQ